MISVHKTVAGVKGLRYFELRCFDELACFSLDRFLSPNLAQTRCCLVLKTLNINNSIVAPLLWTAISYASLTLFKTIDLSNFVRVDFEKISDSDSLFFERSNVSTYGAEMEWSRPQKHTCNTLMNPSGSFFALV